MFIIVEQGFEFLKYITYLKLMCYVPYSKSMTVPLLFLFSTLSTILKLRLKAEIAKFSEAFYIRQHK